MLDKFLVLLERFVVAHEKLAESEAKRTSKSAEWFERHFDKDAEAEHGVLQERTVAAVEEKPARKPRTTKAKPAPEPKLEVEDEPEVEEAPKPKAGKKQGPDLTELRAEIKEMATHIAAGDSDECANEFDDLLDEFKVRTVTKLPDEDVAEFHGLAKEIVGKYYEFED